MNKKILKNERPVRLEEREEKINLHDTRKTADLNNKNSNKGNRNSTEIAKNKAVPEKDKPREINKKNSSDDLYGTGLDIPGSDLEEVEEYIGNEDTETNYYNIEGAVSDFEDFIDHLWVCQKHIGK